MSEGKKPSQIHQFIHEYAAALVVRCLAETIASTGVDFIRECNAGLVDECEHGRNALARLIESENENAIDALAAMGPSEDQLRRVLIGWTQADNIFRTFHDRLAAIETWPKRLAELTKAATDLREFFKEVSVPPTDGVSAWIRVASGDRDTTLRALHLIENLIDGYQRRIAVETPPRLRITRKRASETNPKVGAENAATAWLARRIDGIFDRPFLAQTTILAGVLVRREMEQERVQWAARSEREWREWPMLMQKLSIDKGEAI